MNKIFCLLAVLLCATVLVGCSNPPVPTTTQTGSIPPSPPQPAAVPQITEMTWDPVEKTFHIGIEPWSSSWPWRMLLDGEEIPMEGGEGRAVIRPDAALDQSVGGLYVGSLPWLSGLGDTDFPCCGTVQFDIPGAGLTNAYEYNFGGICQTGSTKACTPVWTVHQGDLVISGSETLLIENMKYQQQGNIYLRDQSTLTLRNAELNLERGATPTIHVYIFVEPGATLNIENSRLYGTPGDGLACVINRGTVRMIDSPTKIHYLDMSEGARLEMTRSELVNDIGGILQISGGTSVVTDSTLGALGLMVPDDGSLLAEGIEPGMTFTSFDVHEMIPEADYDLTLTNTILLQDFPAGPYQHGPYERGWIFFLNRDSHVRLANSQLRKVFLDIGNDTATFSGLKVDVPVSLDYRDISLKNVIISGQWPFTIRDSDLTINDSNYLFLQPSGSSIIRLNYSHIVEFIPRGFSGTMIFDHATWTTAGEIIGDVAYHSDSNNFRMTGSLQIADELRVNLQWKDAFVTREYEVIVSDEAGKPLGGVVLKIGGQEVVTDSIGTARFDLDFDETNYNVPVTLEAWEKDVLIASQQIDFFSETPVRLHK